MNDINFQMINSTSFILDGQYIDKPSYMVTTGFADDTLMWVVKSAIRDEDWKILELFSDLDEAMAWAASMQTETYPTPNYRVELASGHIINRPGKVPLENILAGLGLSFITEIEATACVPFPTHVSSDEVVAHYEGLVRDTAAILGDVVICCEENDNRLWGATILLPVNQFVEISDIENTCKALFDEENIQTLGDYIFRHKPGASAHNAEVFDFAAFASARAKKHNAANCDADNVQANIV